MVTTWIPAGDIIHENDSFRIIYENVIKKYFFIK